MWCRGQDPHPHYVAPGTGPHPTCAGDRTQSPLLGTLDDDEDEAIDDDISFRPPLGPVKHYGSPVYSGHVCVCVCGGILNYNGLHLFQSAGETNTQDHKYWGPCPR